MEDELITKFRRIWLKTAARVLGVRESDIVVITKSQANGDIIVEFDWAEGGMSEEEKDRVRKLVNTEFGKWRAN